MICLGSKYIHVRCIWHPPILHSPVTWMYQFYYIHVCANCTSIHVNSSTPCRSPTSSYFPNTITCLKRRTYLHLSQQFTLHLYISGTYIYAFTFKDVVVTPMLHLRYLNRSRIRVGSYLLGDGKFSQNVACSAFGVRFISRRRYVYVHAAYTFPF